MVGAPPSRKFYIRHCCGFVIITADNVPLTSLYDLNLVRDTNAKKKKEGNKGHPATSATFNYITLSKVQKIRVILRRSENTFHLLQWLSMGKQFLKFKKIKKTFVPNNIAQLYFI